MRLRRLRSSRGPRRSSRRRRRNPSCRPGNRTRLQCTSGHAGTTWNTNRNAPHRRTGPRTRRSNSKARLSRMRNKCPHYRPGSARTRSRSFHTAWGPRRGPRTSRRSRATPRGRCIVRRCNRGSSRNPHRTPHNSAHRTSLRRISHRNNRSPGRRRGNTSALQWMHRRQPDPGRLRSGHGQRTRTRA